MGAAPSSSETQEKYFADPATATPVVPPVPVPVPASCPTNFVDRVFEQPVYQVDTKGACRVNRDLLHSANGVGSHYVVPPAGQPAPLPVCDAPSGWHFSPAAGACVHTDMCGGASRDEATARRCCRDAAYPVATQIAGHPHAFHYGCQDPVPGWN